MDRFEYHFEKDGTLHSSTQGMSFHLLKTGYIIDFPGWNYRGICDHFWHLYCNSGNGISGVITGSGDYPFRNSNILLIPPFTRYNVYAKEPINHFYIHFQPDSGQFPVSRQPWNIPADPVLADQIGSIMSSGPDNYRIICLAKALIQRAFALLPEDACLNTGSRSMDPRIEKAVELYMNSPFDPVKNSVIAKNTGMSVQNFARLFKEQTGLTPREFYRQRQMQICADKLCFTDLSLETLAKMFGYSDRYNLTRIFKKYYGLAPVSYRKKNKHLNLSGIV